MECRAKSAHVCAARLINDRHNLESIHTSDDIHSDDNTTSRKTLCAIVNCQQCMVIAELNVIVSESRSVDAISTCGHFETFPTVSGVMLRRQLNAATTERIFPRCPHRLTSDIRTGAFGFRGKSWLKPKRRIPILCSCELPTLQHDKYVDHLVC